MISRLDIEPRFLAPGFVCRNGVNLPIQIYEKRSRAIFWAFIVERRSYTDSSTGKPYACECKFLYAVPFEHVFAAYCALVSDPAKREKYRTENGSRQFRYTCSCEAFPVE